MFSTLTERGGATTLEALSRGASDFVTKPANVGSVVVAQQRVRDDLIPKIKALCGHATLSALSVAPRLSALPPRAAVPGAPPSRLDRLVIGASTGGPNALAEFIPKLPADFPVPIVLTQHMPPIFTRLLAERLSAVSKLAVREATDGAVLAPGTVWIAPGDFHMTFVSQGVKMVVRLTREAQEHSCRPAVDVMFRSAHRLFAGRILAVVLTGMGKDGMLGAELIRNAGGSVIVQDEGSSVVWGMPGFIANAGLADAVLPLPAIADAVVRRIRVGRSPAGSPSGGQQIAVPAVR